MIPAENILYCQFHASAAVQLYNPCSKHTYPRGTKDVAMDTIFSDTPAIGSGEKMAQFYCGKTLWNALGKGTPNALENIIRLFSDMTKSEMSVYLIYFVTMLSDPGTALRTPKFS